MRSSAECKVQSAQFRAAASIAGFLLLLCTVHLALCTSSYAMEPPPPGMIEKMKRDGTYAHAAAFAKQLGNHKLRTPLRGAALPQLPPQQLADMIQQHMGESVDAKGAKAVSAATPQELSWVQLDLNHDRVVDERDVLVMGYPQPKAAAQFPSLGTIKTFAIQLDFSDYPAWFPSSEIDNNLFGPGLLSDDYKSLKWYYEQASYGQLDIQGAVYPHRASRPRTWYHPDDSNDYPDSWLKQQELVQEAILAADAAGEDFSQYDNDGDGSVDYFLVIWTGPHGAWSTFWWGYFGVGLPADFRVDGVNFTTYSWQWERYYDFGGTAPEDANWDPYVTIHETGHALGLPDYYDYDGGQGPNGGVGGLDMMSGNWGDHSSFSKYVLGWISPTVVFSNLDNYPLRPAELAGDAVICMPGFDPVTPWAEYFIAANRSRQGVDIGIPNDGMLIWQIDARVSNGGGFNWDNSYTDHWLISLEQADGLFEIEGGGGANAGDFFQTGNEFSDSSTPNSKRYDGTATNVKINDFSAPADPMTADFILYTSNPPQVTINSPAGGANVSGQTGIDVVATDDVAVAKVQVLIDGLPVYETAAPSFTYNWNTLVDFNKPLNITVRAWDAEGQAGTAVVGVTVNNAGLIEYNDDFTSAPDQLINWRAENFPGQGRGQLTTWSTRPSPANPPRGGGGNEAWVMPPTYDDTNYGCYDALRSSRIDATGFTRPIQLRFNYRNRGDTLSLWATTDEGLTYTLLEPALPYADDWAAFNKTYDFNGRTVYFRFLYTGGVRGNTSEGQGANIADFSIRQAPSNPPVASFLSPADGAVLSGQVLYPGLGSQHRQRCALDLHP
jgi:M6 family metalloprotease-like protein